MNQLIRYIREELQLNQTEMGQELGVSFSTVNRWENAKAYPNKMAQLRMLDLLERYHLDITPKIYERIEDMAGDFRPGEGSMLLYHGSKNGIVGEIQPISRERCDFGRGFYMGTIPEQPLTLVCDYEESKTYLVSIDLNSLKVCHIETGLEWAMFIAWNRGKLAAIEGTPIYKKYQDFLGESDVISGNIADDRMFYVLDNFFQGNITDKALVESISALKLGEQYAAVTEKACKKVCIEKEIELSFLERKCLQQAAYKKRQEGISLAGEICRRYRREGLYFDEIIANA